MNKTEKRISLYSALLIALLFSAVRLLAARNTIVAQYWRFDATEVLFQFTTIGAYCYLLFILHLTPGRYLSALRERERYFSYILLTLVLFLVCLIMCDILQYRLFTGNHHFRRVLWIRNFSRFMFSTLLSGIIIKIMLLLRDGRRRERDNQQLRNAYLVAELELLKEQINPHFLFNSLSSLSALIKENSSMAQQYISHLAKVFRYALNKPGTTLVTLGNELDTLSSYAELIKIRLEDAFVLQIDVPANYLHRKIPHLSLQPLLENACKHNATTSKKPLTVSINIIDDMLIISNNLQPVAFTDEHSTGIGLYNLAERYRIMLQTEIIIEKTDRQFIVKLPLA
ncbi:histidine kinase [Mucilaginibacter sp. UR6-1]|uniref:sensor histidine kinase n=1 Tax=Mucilaginibacter sp. UR6-1 TaxID=1435643 RepID=UPI001E591C07|nr:histidine kinase [Mucilaginibacter sp. UR6-1]MCC8408309.1 histidine kinase [Mucilaginibacter sp. UR6-1]